MISVILLALQQCARVYPKNRALGCSNNPSKLGIHPQGTMKETSKNDVRELEKGKMRFSVEMFNMVLRILRIMVNKLIKTKPLSMKKLLGFGIPFISYSVTCPLLYTSAIWLLEFKRIVNQYGPNSCYISNQYPFPLVPRFSIKIKFSYKSEE